MYIPRLKKNKDQFYMCGHCPQKCTKKSETLQCDYLESWLHASCEEIFNDYYKMFINLSASPNTMTCDDYDV